MYVNRELDRERIATYSLVVGAYNYGTKAFNETSRPRQRNVDGMIPLQLNSIVCFDFYTFLFLFHKKRHRQKIFSLSLDRNQNLNVLIIISVLSTINSILSAEGYLYDTTTVTVAITDINDNAPTFIRPLFTGGKKSNDLTNGCYTCCITVLYHASQFNFLGDTLWQESKALCSPLDNAQTDSLPVGFPKTKASHLLRLMKKHRHYCFCGGRGILNYNPLVTIEFKKRKFRYSHWK